MEETSNYIKLLGVAKMLESVETHGKQNMTVLVNAITYLEQIAAELKEGDSDA